MARLFHRPSGSIWSHPSCVSSVSPSRRTRHFQPAPALSSQRARDAHFRCQNPPTRLGLNTLKPVILPRIPLQIHKSARTAAASRRWGDEGVVDDVVTFLGDVFLGSVQLKKICLGCVPVSNWKKTHGRFSRGLCWKDYASHLAWEHLWIPQEDLEQAARRREVQIPLWASLDGRAENGGWMRNLQFQPLKSIINNRCFTLQTVKTSSRLAS